MKFNTVEGTDLGDEIELDDMGSAIGGLIGLGASMLAGFAALAIAEKQPFMVRIGLMVGVQLVVVAAARQLFLDDNIIETGFSGLVDRLDATDQRIRHLIEISEGPREQLADAADAPSIDDDGTATMPETKPAPRPRPRRSENE